MKFRDKKNREIEIALTDAEHGIDFTKDFYNVGVLELAEDGAYLVHNIDDLIDQAVDYIRHEGDYVDFDNGQDAPNLYVNGKLITTEN